ncbi:MAG: Gfo/Idh/MocA family oxidoreductase [Bryobacteraceae bacterium]|jgi:predicted dehydrogenase
MKLTLTLLTALVVPLAAQDYKIAIVGLVHSHVWGHLETMVKPDRPARLVAIAEPNAALVAEAKKSAPGVPYYEDYRKMLDEVKPDIVWAFVENNRHLEIVQECAPRKIPVIFEKPLAATLQDALAIERLAAEHGIRVMTNYQMVWWPANYAAKAAADQGAIGQVWRLHGIVGHGFPASVSEGPRNRYFIAWLTDPVANGAGSLVDFGCYNALWSLWYLGRPETVYATVTHLRPDRFPKVEDNADMVLSYKNGVGLFEESWDLPRGFQELEVFGLGGSLYMREGRTELRVDGQPPRDLPLQPLDPGRADPVAYMVSRMKAKQPLDGLVALPINAGVVEILEAAKESVRTGRAVPLPQAPSISAGSTSQTPSKSTK